MFKNYRFLIIFFYFFLITYANSDDRKIVYLNLDLIVQNSIPGKLILEQLENKKKKNIEKFKLEETKIRKKEEDIIKKKNVLSDEEFTSNVNSLKEEMSIYNKERKKILIEFEKNKKKELNEFLKKVTPLIQKFVKENSINIVLNEKNLFIASKKFDITEQIIQIINENIK